MDVVMRATYWVREAEEKDGFCRLVDDKMRAAFAFNVYEYSALLMSSEGSSSDDESGGNVQGSASENDSTTEQQQQNIVTSSDDDDEQMQKKGENPIFLFC